MLPAPSAGWVTASTASPRAGGVNIVGKHHDIDRLALQHTGGIVESKQQA